MTHNQDWQNWRRQQSRFLGESIAWAAKVFQTTEVAIEGSRHYGAALLAQSVECARGIRLCLQKDLPSPAFALARAQYEGALRGHIIIHEIELEVLNTFLRAIGLWQKNYKSTKGPPKIEIREATWRIVGLRSRFKFRHLQHETAYFFVISVGNMGLLHDLAHSGMTHALQMRGKDGLIESFYSDMNQTLLLDFANRVTMFAIRTWPGADQMYRREIEQRVEEIRQMSEMWDETIPD